MARSDIKLLFIPTSPPVELMIPADYPIPPVGGDFYLNYQNFTEPSEWPLVRSILENNVLTVEKIDKYGVYLHEGALPESTDPDWVAHQAELKRYWQDHPETNPATEPYPRFYIAHTQLNIPMSIPPENGKRRKNLTALRIVGIFESIEDYLEFEEDYNLKNERLLLDPNGGVHLDVIEVPRVFDDEGVEIIDRFVRGIMDEFLARTEPEHYLVVLSKKPPKVLSVERTDRSPWDNRPTENANPNVEVHFQDDGQISVWCNATSRNDACRLAFFPVYMADFNDRALDGWH